MSSSIGIRVRCLASTRIWQEAQYEESDFKEREVEDEVQTTNTNKDSVGEATPEALQNGPDQVKKEHPDLEEGEVSDSGSSSSFSSDFDSGSDTRSDATDQSAVHRGGRRNVSCIQSAQLSPDGTCIFTTDYNRAFSVYPIDNDIVNEPGTRSLKPYAQFVSADPIWAFAINPNFGVNDGNTTHVLVSRRNQYISLHNALWDLSRPIDAQADIPRTGPVNISTKVSRYKLIDHLTEDVRAPTSLAYSHDGKYFYAGEQNTIAVFDLEYTDDPISKILTIPAKRNKLKGGGRGFKGYISALALSPASPTNNAGILAAGARTRHVGLYDAISGRETTHITLPGTFQGKKLRNDALSSTIGDGVSQLKWSPDGNYLYVAERMSDAILIYDVRNVSLTLGYCAGRKALTKQRLGFDVWTAGDATYGYDDVSPEIWAGGTDGKIRVWRDPCLKEGAIEADEVVDVSDAPVVASLVHPYGNLAVAASGKYEICGDDEAAEGKGQLRGGGIYPKFREWGCLDILGLGGYEPTTAEAETHGM
ncbi:hypothetical protein BU26DRAFT_512675 [Trematosphaeria pertusa]|uniref:WD40 repeat-like protein n=1 Tax=Trematosphaeria pertusa TaxID=390896 RepID=A0A6A6IZ50_9PLEO|nr:uncharacterized protein BU26DRAFT_512675 [Trematosphaeria pertusa]KAF2255704.1 hypothetical protein BU26DRAFT_512675 [Trematosphaeria pertusa]